MGLLEDDLVVEGLSHFGVFPDWGEQVVLDVLEDGLEEGVACVLDAVVDPRLEVQELPLACQDGKWHCELIVVPVSQRDQALLDDLGDVENA